MITIGILIFPQVEELDFVGPFEIVSYVNKIRPESTKVLLIAETLEPIVAFNGLKVFPSVAIEGCPQLDVLIVPGGKGRIKAMHNPRIHEFLLRQSKGTLYTTSVCTGALLLAEAGLLAGKKATTYHTAFAELATYSVEVVKAKVVQDGKLITAAGVSSGLELGFYLLVLLFGRQVANEVADNVEYEVDLDALCEEAGVST